ncbi:MAG: FtsX-like permease family protein [Ruminococcaceae bacterium]|nr:FtsX-like permease family protein [Oscillospiraceae bacterium]
MNRHNLFYHFREGVKGIFSHGFMSLASVTVMVTCLVLTGTVLLLVMSLNLTIESMVTLSDIRAYVDESYSEEEAEAIGNKLRMIENVSGVDFISNSRALDEMRDQFGTDAWLLDGLEYDNPLRHNFRIMVVSIDGYEDTVADIAAIPGISDVHSSVESVSKLSMIRNILGAASFALMVMLGAVAVVIISNTIKLATFDRREEIAIMKMIGATDGFIRFPFVIESVILSQAAAGIAFGLQWLVYNYLIGTGLSSIELIRMVDFTTVKYYFLGGFMGIAFIFGVLGSAISIRKFLKV